MTHYTVAEVLTILTALGVLLTAFGAVVVNIIVALRQSTKIEATAKAVDTVGVQVEQVHTAVNSNYAAVKAELSAAVALNIALTNQITELRALVQDLKNQREQAAIATATLIPVPPIGAST